MIQPRFISEYNYACYQARRDHLGDLGFRVLGLGFWASGFRVWGFRFWVWGFWLRDYLGLGFRDEGFRAGL